MILTEREQKLVILVTEGFKNKEIAKLLGTTEGMIKNKLLVIYDKVGMWNRLELALWWLKGENSEVKIVCSNAAALGGGIR